MRNCGTITGGMRATAPRRSPSWLAGSTIALLLLVGVVALGALHTTLPLHLHHGSTAGAYNEEHVLAALESATGEVPLAAEPPGAGIDLAAAEPPRAADAPLPDPTPRSARSRAPPLA